MLKHVLVVALAASVALTGCAGGSSRYSSASSNSTLTADQKVLRANAERVDPEAAGGDTVGEAVLIGAVVLGAVGCGIEALTRAQTTGIADATVPVPAEDIPEDAPSKVKAPSGS